LLENSAVNSKYRASFVRTAGHWNALAKMCDGELHPLKSWCSAVYPTTDIRQGRSVAGSADLDL